MLVIAPCYSACNATYLPPPTCVGLTSPFHRSSSCAALLPLLVVQLSFHADNRMLSSPLLCRQSRHRNSTNAVTRPHAPLHHLTSTTTNNCETHISARITGTNQQQTCRGGMTAPVLSASQSSHNNTQKAEHNTTDMQTETERGSRNAIQKTSGPQVNP